MHDPRRIAPIREHPSQIVGQTETPLGHREKHHAPIRGQVPTIEGSCDFLGVNGSIEALQRRFIDAHPDQFRTKVVADRRVWTSLAREIAEAITKLPIADDDKKMLLDGVGGLNRLPQRIITEQVVRSIGIEIGVDESEAWKRRNDAAHGNEIEDGTELEAIRDMKLLNVLFHRMLLRITNASDGYFDYCTPGFPIRSLREPVPQAS